MWGLTFLQSFFQNIYLVSIMRKGGMDFLWIKVYNMKCVKFVSH